jgi:hypothetical protein
MKTLVLTDIARRIEKLEIARGVGISPPYPDCRAELIRRVNLVAERAEASEEIPPISEAEQAQIVAAFHEWIRERAQ